MTKLKPGQYLLGRDVLNPRADRRVKYDVTKHAVWRAETRVTIDAHEREPIAGVELPPTLTCWIHGARGHVGRIDEFDERFALIAEACVPAEESLATLRDRLRFEDREILEELVAAGDVTLLDIEVAYERLCAREEGGVQ